MASTSSLIFMAADETTSQEAAAAAVARAVRAEEARPEAAVTRTRGRKPSNKAANGKKQPQRGLGVAQLERLRLVERHQKIAEMLQLHLQPVNFPLGAAAAAAEPLQSVPVQYGAGGPGGHHSLMAVPQPHHGGFGVGVGVGVGSHYHHHPVNNFVMNIDRDPTVQTCSKELSSKPKPSLQLDVPSHHDYQSFDICTFKKKRYNEEITGGSMREIAYGNLMNLFGGDQLGLGFGHTPQNAEGVEVVAVHRKESNQGGHVGDDEVVMEYQFFPGHKNAAAGSISGSGSKEILQIMPSEILGSGEASYYNHHGNANASVASTYGADASNNPVDLALKL